MITGLNHITLAVVDLDRSFTFYRDVMKFKPLCRWTKGAYFMAGDLWFCLSVDDKRKPAEDYTHYAFSVSDFAAFQQELLDHGVIEFQTNKSPGNSFYFLDPDGHKLEIHAGSGRERLEYMKKNSSDVEFFV